jgi:hypothetical protein
MAFLDIKDGNGNDKKLHTSLTGSHLDENMPHNVIQEISGSSISSVITALNQISSSVKTGGSVQTITASYDNPIPITGSINVDVQVSDLITVTSSLANPVVVGLYGSNNNRAFIDSSGAQLVTSSNSAPVYVSASLANPVGITGSATVNNLTQTAHNSSTYSGLLTPIGIVGSSGNRVTVDSNNALLTTGSVTVNNLKDTDYNSTSYTAGKLTPIGLVGSSGYRANVDSNGAQLVTSSNSAPVYVSASLANPVGITGSTTINNLTQTAHNSSTYSGLLTPIGFVGSTGNRAFVDSNGAQLVTSSNSAPVYVSASLANPVGITGSATVNNLTQTNHNSSTYSGLLTPIGLVGNSGNRATVDSSNALLTTGSVTVNNLKDTDYNSTSYSGKVTPSGLVGYSGYRLQIDSSGSLIATSSYANPIVVTASFSQPLATRITSSNSDFSFTRHVVPTGAIRSVFSTTDNSIDFDDLTNFGAFAICSNNINRKGLTITNPTPQRLFIAIATQASSSGAGRNCFDLTNNTSDPNSYSFVIYPSGSYFADSTNVTLFYGGYFVSSSNALKAMVTETY